MQALHLDPTDRVAWLALADSLEENGELERAEMLRLREQLRLDIEAEDREAKEKRLQQLLLDGTAPIVASLTLPIDDKVSITFSLIPPGEFLMGSLEKERERYTNEGPQHPVEISYAYYLAIHPVTQAQWSALMDTNRSTHTGKDRPVDSASQPECAEYCRLLSERLDRRVRLPYEAEWEYACRCGTQTEFYTGNGARAGRRAGWFSERSGKRETRKVCQLVPNGYGLYDMHGNVREWCQDDLRTFTAQRQIDPRGREDTDYRVVRGGSWYYGPEDSRSASRYNRPIDYHLGYYGFRVVLCRD